MPPPHATANTAVRPKSPGKVRLRMPEPHMGVPPPGAIVSIHISMPRMPCCLRPCRLMWVSPGMGCLPGCSSSTRYTGLAGKPAGSRQPAAEGESRLLPSGSGCSLWRSLPSYQAGRILPAFLACHNTVRRQQRQPAGRQQLALACVDVGALG